MQTSVLGKDALSSEDLAAAVASMQKRLQERNVSSDVARALCDSVALALEGRSLASFTRVSAIVRGGFEDAITRILTPPRSLDVLAEIRAAKAKGKPYSIVFVGVNGVGKSTNLAKIAYWLRQQGLRVMIAACDTFRCAPDPPSHPPSHPQLPTLATPLLRPVSDPSPSLRDPRRPQTAG